MIRKEVIEKIGYLDEIFYPFGCEDIDFFALEQLMSATSSYRCQKKHIK